MSGSDLLVIVGNLGGCAAAIAVNLWAVRFDDPRRWPLWSSIAALAAIYTVGYVWLITSDDVVTWSRMFRGVSLVTWPIVWWSPAIIVVTHVRRDHRRLTSARTAAEERFDL